MSTVTSKHAQHWLERATSLGAVAAEVLVKEEDGHRLRVIDGKVVQSDVIQHNVVTVTAFARGGGRGVASSEVSDAGTAVASAVAAALEAEGDLTAGPVRGLRTVDFRELGIDDRRWPQVGDAERRDVVVSAERGARVDKRVRTDPFTYEDCRTRRLFASTAEVLVEEYATHFRCEGGVRVGGDDAVVALTDFVEGRSFATVSSLPFGLNMARRALHLLDNRIELTGPVRVALDARPAAALFAALADVLVRGETTFFSGSAPLGSRLHLLDDGALPGGLRTAAFDDRGVPPVPVILLREGQLHQSYKAPVTARGDDERPTGHFWGGALRASNLILRGGTRSINAVLSERSDVDALVVSDLVGLENIDWATGDFEWTAYGVLRRGNEELGGVPGVRLRGNLSDVFSQVVDLTSDTDRIGHVDASGMLLDGFIAG